MDLARFTAHLTQGLDRSFALTPAAEAAAHIDYIEQYIAKELEEAIVAAILHLEPRAIRLPPNGFALLGRPFEVIVDYRDLLKNDIIGVLITEIQSATPLVRVQCDLHGQGRYKKADVMVAPRLSNHLNVFAELTQQFYKIGYTWLHEFLIAKARELESSMVIELYRILRLAFSDKPGLADQVWLVVVHRDRGIYVFDQHATERMVDVLISQRGKTKGSAAALFLGLLTSDVPFDQMFSRHAIPTGECLHCDLSKSEYVGTEPLYAIAEHVLYKYGSGKSKVASIYPIARRDQPYLIAAFATSEELEILPVLRKHRKEMEDAFRGQTDRAEVLLHKLKSISAGRLPIGPIFEALGYFTKGIFGL